MNKNTNLTVLAAGVIFTSIALSGCAVFKGPQAKQKAAVTACNGYASALATAAAFRMQGKFKPDQIHIINNVESEVHPLCTAPTIPDTQSALAKIETATSQLQFVNHKVKQ